MKKQRPKWKQEQRRQYRKLRGQQKKANIRKKYGPRGKPNPVTITRPGQEPQTVDPGTLRPTTIAPSLDEGAKRAGFANYAAYLASSEWKERRRQVLERDRWRCTRCGSKKRLQVHHRYYGHIGSEPLKSLQTLCSGCHQRTHA